jgi:hypothetical protein
MNNQTAVRDRHEVFDVTLNKRGVATKFEHIDTSCDLSIMELTPNRNGPTSTLMRPVRLIEIFGISH